MRSRESTRARGGLRATLLALLTFGYAASARAQEVIEYYGTDHLGSVRVVFDATGTVISRADYLPYGEEMFAPTGPMPAQQFTGQARDGEAGQDYFHARMYQPRTGRFNAVDPVFNATLNPQKWNRFSYAINRPTVLVDPDGLDPRNHPDYDFIMGGLLAGPAGRAYGDGGGGGGGARPASEFSQSSEREHNDRLRRDFWEDVISFKAPTTTPHESERGAVKRTHDVMWLATADTGWEWARNVYYDSRTDSYYLGNPVTGMDSGTVPTYAINSDRSYSEGGRTWTAIHHTHPRGNPYPSGTPENPVRPGEPNDVAYANRHGVSIYSGNSNRIYVYLPPRRRSGSSVERVQ